jgi:predicted  nucleic acid-binding Zn-ribbon protein
MTQKLDKIHLESIQKLQEQFSNNNVTLGNITAQEYLLQQDLNQIQQEKNKYLSELEQLRKQEQELLTDLKNRYGDGQINIEDGTFTSS